MNKGSSARTVRVGTRMPTGLRDRLAGFCAASGIAECRVIAAGVEQYLDGTSDMTLLLRRLDRLGRAVERLHRDQQLSAQAFAVFVELWFAHTPAIAEQDKDAARATAHSRYRLYLEHVAEQFSGGRRFVDDLPKEAVANDAELDALVAKATGPGNAAG